MFKTITAFCLSLALLAGCQSGQGPNKQQVGTVGGAVIGGILGSNVGGGQGRTAAIIGGTLLGAWAGSSIGASLDKADMMYANQAQNVAYTAPIGEEIAWNNPESGHEGTFTPVRDGTAASGAYCREFQQTITIDGRTERAYGTACQMPDGTWQIRN
jgi:surface antigen